MRSCTKSWNKISKNVPKMNTENAEKLKLSFIFENLENEEYDVVLTFSFLIKDAQNKDSYILQEIDCPHEMHDLGKKIFFILRKFSKHLGKNLGENLLKI